MCISDMDNISLYRDSSPQISMDHLTHSLPSAVAQHLHNQYEIYYNVSGADSFFFGNQFYRCTGHDLFVIPKTCVHKVIVKPDVVYERCIVSVDSNVIAALNSAPYVMGSLNWIDYVGVSLPGKITLDNEEKHNTYMSFIDEFTGAEDDLVRLSALMKLLSFIGKYFKYASPVDSIVPRDIPEKALLIIEEDFRDVKISDIARKLYVNDSYLSRVFRQKCGITLSNYLILRKLAEAKKYLYMGVSVKEACFLSGFNNYSNFIRTFKNFEGVSPGNFEI